jgi:hypothetical protein
MEPGKDYVLIRDGEEPTDRQLAVLTGKHNIFWNNKYYCCFLEGKCWLQTSYPRNVLTMIAKKCSTIVPVCFLICLHGVHIRIAEPLPIDASPDPGRGNGAPLGPNPTHFL